MSFPGIPNITPTISLSTAQTVPLLLASIALEELSLAHIMNAEAEKLQLVLGTLTPTRTTFSPAAVTLSNLLTLDTSVQRTLRDVIKKEMLLEFKFENVLDLIGTLSPPATACTPATETFTNQTAINNIGEVLATSIATTTPYPSPITVAGLQGVISKVTVTINGYTDEGDGDPAGIGHLQLLVVAPNGSAVLIVSEAGNGTAIAPPGVTFTIQDGSLPLPPNMQFQNGGIYGPTVTPGTNNNFPTAVLPQPSPPQPGSYPEALSVFNGLDPNGEWRLYATDPFGGHGIVIERGWSLTISTTCP